MKYRLKSDPTVKCETVGPVPYHVLQVAYVHDGVVYRCPAQVFRATWESVSGEKAADPEEKAAAEPCDPNAGYAAHILVTELQRTREALHEVEHERDELVAARRQIANALDPDHDLMVSEILDRIKRIQERASGILYSLHKDDCGCWICRYRREIKRLEAKVGKLEAEKADPQVSYDEIQRVATILVLAAQEMETSCNVPILSVFERRRRRMIAEAYRLGAERLFSTELEATAPAPTPES